MKDAKWFREDGTMSPFGENGVLFTAEYCVMENELLPGSTNVALLGHRVLKTSQVEEDYFSSGEKHFSHDNLTGVFCLSKTLGTDHHKKIWFRNYWAYLHPRDFLWYLWANQRWYSYLVLPFFPIITLAMMHSCWSDFKVRNGNKILKTDGKILSFLRLKAFNMPITARLCDWVLRNNKEFGSWKKCFEIYFRDPEHPLRNFPDEMYEVVKK